MTRKQLRDKPAAKHCGIVADINCSKMHLELESTELSSAGKIIAHDP